jgi:dipeptidyl aminopeptidase/acylaminoacyl peptidase
VRCGLSVRTAIRSDSDKIERKRIVQIVYEELINFISDGIKLYGMLHHPLAQGPHPAVMLLHGFTGQRVESHRIFVKLARRLASNGLAALRFDFRGSGESEGEFADITIARWVRDALAGLDWLAERQGIDPDQLGVLGLSIGGCTAAIVAGRRPEQVKALALWSAAADVARVIPEWLRGANPIPLENGYDVGGNILGQDFLTELPDVHPAEEVARFPGPALIVHGTMDEIVPFTNADAFAAALAGRARKHLVSGANHTFTRVSWETEVLGVTADFFLAKLLSTVGETENTFRS